MAVEGKPRDGRSARAQQTRASIVAAATMLFGTRGVSASSIDDIASAAGIAKGSIYNNFGSKTDLVDKLIREQIETLDVILEDACTGRSGRDERRAIVAALIEAVAERQNATRFIVSELFRTDRDWAGATDDWRGVTTDRLARSLREEFPTLSEEAASTQAAAMLGAALLATMDWLVFHPERSYEKVLGGVLTVIGLAPDQERPAAS